jgi:hypothetical protein
MSAVRTRYQKSDGTPVWLEYDPLFPCIYCAEPVGALSTGGPAVCARCDCGQGPLFFDYNATIVTMAKARDRLDAIPFDESWALYESAWLAIG